MPKKRNDASSKHHASQKKKSNSATKPINGSSTSDNKPRNLLLLDASGPLTFQFRQYGTPITLTFDQTAEESTWPGGAVWDLGWVLARFFCGSVATTTTMPGQHTLRRPGVVVSNHVHQLPLVRQKLRCILELGCGVGLTGIVAAAALHPSLTLLTDLRVVVDRVTHPNVLRNTVRTTGVLPKSGGSRILALPLCWGNADDETAVWERMGRQAPDLVIVGDVAYQHKPGAPSHFEALVSTMVRLAGPSTMVVMGVRIRMPASVDLVHMIQEHFVEAAAAVSVEDIEPSLAHVKHNMTIHFFRKKKGSAGC